MTQEYKELVEQWKSLKVEEQRTNAKRLEVEKKILALVGDLKESGVSELACGLRITTALAYTCHKKEVDELFEKIRAGRLVLPDVFPFRAKWDVDAKAVKHIQDNMPGLYNEHIAKAITVKRRKPAFEVHTKKGE